MPLLVGGFLELPLGVLAGQGRRRRLAILVGGVIFVLALLGVASAHSFTVLLCAFVAFYPASGAFVSLTQADIMDAWPDRQAQVMVRWDLAGSTGAVAGPLLLTAVLASGGGWRVGYLVLAGLRRARLDRRVPARPGGCDRERAGPGGGPAGRSRAPAVAGRGRGRSARKSAGRCGTGGRCAGCC